MVVFVIELEQAEMALVVEEKEAGMAMDGHGWG